MLFLNHAPSLVSLASILMILVGSAWLKRYLMRILKEMASSV